MAENKKKTGTVFNIQRFSIHDGPGIRTTVFLKGCSLRCFWCHNPESLSAAPQIQYYESRCIGCRSCSVCPNSAHTFRDGRHIFDRILCAGCGLCAEKCYPGALTLSGKKYSPDELFAEILKDRPFYNESGGVTFSGGEPLLQYQFIAETAAMCREAGINVAVDTAGFAAFEAFEAALPFVSLFLYDLKHADPVRHRQYTGADNALIIRNLYKLLSGGAAVWIRVPLIPGVNDTAEDMGAIASLAAEARKASGNKIKKFELMPFHGTAGGKYESLGLKYAAENLKIIDKEKIAALKETAEKILDMPV